jgi:7 transmembrane receptor (rhodopsin family)
LGLDINCVLGLVTSYMKIVDVVCMEQHCVSISLFGLWTVVTHILTGQLYVSFRMTVIFVLIQHKKKMMNELLINQLIIDFYSCLMTIPTYVISLCNIYYSETPGYILCITFNSETLMWIGLSSSPINLTVIAVERYIKIVHSIWHKNHWRPCMAYCGCALPWASGVGFNLVVAVLTTSVSSGYCIVEFPTYIGLMTFGWTILLYNNLLPLALFTVCYTRIFLAIRRQNRIFPRTVRVQASNADASSTTASAADGSKLSQSEMNALKTVIGLSVSLAVAWIPFTTLYLIHDITNWPLIWPVYYASEIFMIISITINPFIYVIGLPDIRGYLYGKVVCREDTSSNNRVDSGVS